jgi:transcriptional regulator with GAF, ATPase, and Fis domain
MAGLCLRTSLEKEALRDRARSLEHDLHARHRFPGIITAHPQMIELLRTVAQVADTDAGILLLGESGTGKELIARAVHLNSGRASRAFVALHAAALPASVLESELFGHVRGAFTGAARDRAGRLAAAEGGTLFLDEVAEVSPELQVKLLRFLQCGEIQRVGSDRTETLDVRIVAATHADLRARVQERDFREDLYYRLRVLELRIPPLRERMSDLPLLVEHFLEKYWRRQGETPRLSSAAEAALRHHCWPGNVRELEHTVQRMCLLAKGPELGSELLPDEVQAPLSAVPRVFRELTNAELKTARERAAAEAEREFVGTLMERHAGNISKAARAAGLQRRYPKAARAAGLQRRYLQRLLARHRGEGGSA